MIWIIAWKNIWRNRVRSLVVIMAITFGLMGGIFSSAVMKGAGEQRIREAVNRETAHLQIHHPAFTDDQELQYAFPQAHDTYEVLDTLQGIAGWSPRIILQAMINSANAGTGVVVSGVSPEQETRVSELASMICDSCGQYLNGEKPNQIVIGKALARKLKVRLRSKIVLTFQDAQGELIGSAFRVCGIFQTSNSSFDEMHVFVDRREIAALLGLPPETCHEIAILVSDPGKIPDMQQRLSILFPDLLIRNWKQIDPMLGMLADFMDMWLYLFMVIILLALGFGIVNTMLMVILERTRELGMLTAIGMTRWRVFLMIMLESVFLSLTGAVTGMILSLTVIGITSQSGINLSSFAQGFEKMGYNPVLYPYLDPDFFVILTLLVILTGILASVYPARKALKLNPAEAVRTE